MKEVFAFETPIQMEYYEWMRDMVCDPKYFGRNHWDKLFSMLHNRTFVHILAMDSNRSADGIALRRRFCIEKGYIDDHNNVATIFHKAKPCSIFEMMVALALRCEERIMGDPDNDDRTGKWFYEMIDSLGLCRMDDDHIHPDTVEKILDNFIDRHFQRNGRGSLFTVSKKSIDMRKFDIWYQMMWYLDEVIYERR